MLHSKQSISRAGQLTGAALLLATLAACGGGGGSAGGGTASSSSSSSSTTSSSTGSPPPAPVLTGLGCVAAAGGGSGYILGVCSVVTNGVEAIAAGFQNFPATVTSNPAPNTSKTFTLNLQTPVSPGAKSVDASLENCANNQLGTSIGFLAEVFDNANAPTTSPRYSILTFSQGYGARITSVNNVQTDLCRRSGNPITAPALPNAVPLAFMDVGVWERYLGDAALYYGGWYSQRGTTSAAATAGKTYGAGKAFGYRFTADQGFGMSADIAAGATWNGSTMTLQISSFNYSRANVTTPNPGAPFPVITLRATAISGKAVTGLVEGTGISGIFEGEFGGPAGEEFAGRFQFVQPASGHKASGSFAIK